MNKLNDSEGKDIEVFIKSNKTKKNEYEHFLTGKKEFSIISKKNSKKYNGNNYNNNIIFIKHIYKGCNSSSAKKYRDYLNKKNSFNCKIKINKKSIENSKNKLNNKKKTKFKRKN